MKIYYNITFGDFSQKITISNAQNPQRNKNRRDVTSWVVVLVAGKVSYLPPATIYNIITTAIKVQHVIDSTGVLKTSIVNIRPDNFFR